MKHNKENTRKRIIAAIAYVLCIIVAIFLFSGTKDGGGGGTGNGTGTGTGDGTGSGEGNGAGNGKGGGEGDSTDSGDSHGKGGNQKVKNPSDSVENNDAAQSEAGQDRQNATAPSESQEKGQKGDGIPIEMENKKPDVTEDEKKVWSAAIERTRKLCKSPEKSKFPDFGVKDTEITKANTDDGIPTYQVKGFYLVPDSRGVEKKTCFECRVIINSNGYFSGIPVLR